jgi:hypothetical protein
MSKRPKTKPLEARVIRDSRNGNRDYYLPYARAKELHEQGVLDWDITNGCYCTKNPSDRPT